MTTTPTLRRTAIVGLLLAGVGLVWWLQRTDAPARGAAAPHQAADIPSEGDAPAPSAPRPAEERSELAATPVTSENEPEVAPPSAPRACSVTGITRFEPGITGGPVALALYALSDGKPEREAADRTTVAAGERYCLRSAIAGRHALVAVARGGTESFAELLRPATALVELAEGVEVQLEPLELGWGESLAGQVVRPDGAPITEASLSVRLLEGARGPTLVDLAQLCWKDERLELGTIQRHLAGDTFLIRGLAPQRYELTGRDDTAFNDGVPGISIGVVAAAVEATASAVGIVVSTGKPAPVRFRVTGSGRPLPANIEVNESAGTRANKEGLVELVVDPAKRYEIEFSHIEYVARRLVYEPNTLEPGSTIDVGLEPGPIPASLSIVLTESVAARLAEHPIDMWVYTAEEALQNRLVDKWPGAFYSGPSRVRFSKHSAVLVREGPRLSVEVFPPGRYLVRVIPRTVDGVGLPVSMWLEERFELELAPGEHAERLVQPVLGGRVRFDVRGTPSSRVEFELEGRSAHGAGLDFVWQGTDSGIGSSNRPRIPGISDLMQPLQPGPWAVHVRAREATLRTVKFTVSAGATTDVVIELTGL